MIDGYETNLYLRDNKARITDLDFDDNYIRAKIKSCDYELEFSYKTNIGTIAEYIEFDLQQLNKEIIDMAKRYFLSKTKGKGDKNEELCNRI